MIEWWMIIIMFIAAIGLFFTALFKAAYDIDLNIMLMGAACVCSFCGILLAAIKVMT